MDMPIPYEFDSDPMEPLNIDQESFKDVDPIDIFIAGVEWQSFLEKSRSTSPFTMAVTALNVERLISIAERHGRRAAMRPLEYLEGREFKFPNTMKRNQ